MTLPGGPEPGLCGSCANVRRVVSGRGSVFFLCTLSAVDPQYPRYPRLPVLTCAGWRKGGVDDLRGGPAGTGDEQADPGSARDPDSDPE